MRTILLLFSSLTIGLCLFASGCGSSHRPVGADDGGPLPSDGDLRCTAPMPRCYAGWSGDPWCCLDGPAPAACVEDRWACPRGLFLESECGRVAASCEGIDAGPPPPPPSAYYACGAPSDCVVTANSCCGVCGRPTASDVDAVNGDLQMDWYLDVACPEARDEPPICPGCASMPNASLIAGCDFSGASGRCTLVDIENDRGLAGCTTDDECVVRVPDCCECGADTSIGNLVAIHRDRRADLEAIVCDPGTGCFECAPTYPSDVSAACVSGLCRLVGMGMAP